MNPTSDWPVELEAGQAVERFSLAPIPFSGDRKELFVCRQAGGKRRVFSVVERTSSADGTRAPRETMRFINLEQDAILPLYAIASQPRLQWNVEVVYGGISAVDYPFQTKTDAFRLQRLLTGYDPVAHFKNVTCSVVFKNSKRFLGRDCQHTGCGEIQLWWPDLPSKPGNPLTLVSSESGGSSPGVSILSRTPSFPRPMSVSSVQTDHERGREVLVSALPPGPLLVAFLRDGDAAGGYTMLRIELDDLSYGTPRDDQITFRGHDRQTFAADRLSVDRFRLNTWNLCAVAAKLAGTSSLKCTYLSVKFHNPARLEEMGQFERDLLQLQLRRAKLKADRVLDRAMFCGAPPTTAPVPKARPPESVPTWAPSTTGSPRLPVMTTAEPLAEAILRELESEQESRELDSQPPSSRFELNGVVVRDGGIDT